jgi:hypothetical protein
MLYRLLADLVLLLHLAFIIFVVTGGLLALRWHWAPLLHLPATLWGVFVEISRGICPLTPLENSLRRAAGASGYSGGFIEHYIAPVIYPPALNPPTQFALACFVVAANLLVYWIVWRRHSSRRRGLAD